jgi:hypothetical protein
MSYTTRVTSLDHVPTQSSAKVASCDKCCIRLSGIQLQILNLVDLTFGVLMLWFGLLLYDQIGSSAFTNPHVAWLCWLSTLIGTFLSLSVLMAACGLTGGEGMRWCVTPSSYLGILVGILAALISIPVFTEKNDVFDHLNSHGVEYGLTQPEIDHIESWYKFIGPILVLIFILQILRFRASNHYRNNIGKLDGEFEALLEEDDKAWADKLENNKVQREEKYNNLRDHYKNKYQPPAGTGTVDTGTAGTEDSNLGGNTQMSEI